MTICDNLCRSFINGAHQLLDSLGPQIRFKRASV